MANEQTSKTFEAIFIGIFLFLILLLFYHKSVSILGRFASLLVTPGKFFFSRKRTKKEIWWVIYQLKRSDKNSFSFSPQLSPPTPPSPPLAVPDHFGTHFTLAFMTNSHNDGGYLKIFIATTEKQTDVKIIIPSLGYEQTATIPGKTVSRCRQKGQIGTCGANRDRVPQFREMQIK